jgi:hypothetical protein
VTYLARESEPHTRTQTSSSTTSSYILKQRSLPLSKTKIKRKRKIFKRKSKTRLSLKPHRITPSVAALRLDRCLLIDLKSRRSLSVFLQELRHGCGRAATAATATATTSATATATATSSLSVNGIGPGGGLEEKHRLRLLSRISFDVQKGSLFLLSSSSSSSFRLVVWFLGISYSCWMF